MALTCCTHTDTHTHTHTHIYIHIHIHIHTHMHTHTLSHKHTHTHIHTHTHTHIYSKQTIPMPTCWRLEHVVDVGPRGLLVGEKFVGFWGVSLQLECVSISSTLTNYYDGTSWEMTGKIPVAFRVYYFCGLRKQKIDIQKALYLFCFLPQTADVFQLHL